MSQTTNFLGFAKSTIDLQEHVDPRVQNATLVLYGGFVSIFNWEDGNTKKPDRNPQKNETVTKKNFPNIVKSDFLSSGRWVRSQFDNLTYKAFHKHSQKKPLSMWVIRHNMGRTPSVTVIDSADNVVVGNVHYLGEQILEIEFSSGFSGTAYLT